MTESSDRQYEKPLEQDYNWKLQKEAEFWGTMARLRWRGGIPTTMDFQRATRYRVRRSDLGWGDYFQDPTLEAQTPFGRARIRFVQTARNSEGRQILDLCCGAGWLALEQARAGKMVDAVDLSLEEITVAKEYQSTLEEEIPGRISWIVTDLNTFEAQENKYDQATSWDGLHHIQQIDRLCAQINRALKPNGRFMISERVWGGDRPSVRARIGKYMEQHLWTILPTPAPYTYRRKFKELSDTYKLVFKTKILRKEHKWVPWQLENEGCCSPFEDACGGEILDAIEKYFHIERIERYYGFTEEIQRSLNLPRFLRAPVILFFSWLDHVAVKLGLLEGKIMILYGCRKDPAQISDSN